MDIGPVSAIRSVTSIRSFSSQSEVSRIGETQHRNQSGDDEHSPPGRQPGRGLEDEEGEELASEESSGTATLGPPSGMISFFA